MGRVAFVSGGSRGIGRAIAEALAAAGHTVAIGDIREAEPVGEGGIAVLCDVTDSGSVAAAVREVEDAARARSRSSSTTRAGTRCVPSSRPTSPSGTA